MTRFRQNRKALSLAARAGAFADTERGVPSARTMADHDRPASRRMCHSPPSTTLAPNSGLDRANLVSFGVPG